MGGRTIIQISTCAPTNPLMGANVIIHALCSDGTLWVKTGRLAWELVESVPE